jgi:hypothetical protein
LDKFNRKFYLTLERSSKFYRWRFDNYPLGEGKYFINRKANKINLKSKNLMLHAYKIKFIIKNIKYNFKAEYNTEFEKFLKINF